MLFAPAFGCFREGCNGICAVEASQIAEQDKMQMVVHNVHWLGRKCGNNMLPWDQERKD